jgi:8-oxo-dGTP pyrophosphatase MutT (NUDIX family)
MTRHKAKVMAKKGKPIRQVGVLAYRRGPKRELQFMLITSRETRRFTIPKGWQIKGKNEAQSAGKEAKQEAGITGRLGSVPLGEYQYWKRLRSAFVPITVRVFAMEVGEELSDWRERRQRQRAWLKPEQAAALVDEPALADLLLDAARKLEDGVDSVETSSPQDTLPPAENAAPG